jgi:hypothetical protein
MMTVKNLQIPRFELGHEHAAERGVKHEDGEHECGGDALLFDQIHVLRNALMLTVFAHMLRVHFVGRPATHFALYQVLQSEVVAVQPDQVLAEELADVGDRHQRQRDSEEREENADQTTVHGHWHWVAVADCGLKGLNVIRRRVALMSNEPRR